MFATLFAILAVLVAHNPAAAQQPQTPAAAETGLVPLTIKVTPSDARVRIMNIKPAYTPGMKVKPGLYHVRVEHDAYAPWDGWLKVEGTSFIYPVKLKTPAANPKSDTQAAPATKPVAPPQTPIAKQPAPKPVAPAPKTTPPATNVIVAPALPKTEKPAAPVSAVIKPAPTNTVPVVPKVKVPDPQPAPPATPKIEIKPQTSTSPKLPNVITPKKPASAQSKSAAPTVPQPKFGTQHTFSDTGLVVTMPTPPSDPATKPSPRPVPAAKPKTQAVPVIRAPKRAKNIPSKTASGAQKAAVEVLPKTGNSGFLGKAMRWSTRSAGGWWRAIAEPKDFLHPAFKPSTAQIFDGAVFHIVMLAIALVLYIPLMRTTDRTTGSSARVFAAAVLFLATTAVVAMASYVAFWILGGKSNIAGTYLAYAYSTAPYLPIFALASFVVAFGFPRHLRHRAVNPQTAEQVIKVALTDTPRRSPLLILGALALLVLIPWSLYVLMSAMGFVHKFSFMQCLTAFAVSVPLFGLIYFLNKRLAGALLGQHVDQYDFDEPAAEYGYASDEPEYEQDGATNNENEYDYEAQPGMEPNLESNDATDWPARPETLQSPTTPKGAQDGALTADPISQTDASSDPRLMPPTLPPIR